MAAANKLVDHRIAGKITVSAVMIGPSRGCVDVMVGEYPNCIQCRMTAEQATEFAALVLKQSQRCLDYQEVVGK